MADNTTDRKPDFIDAEDPLPGGVEDTWRWAMPYIRLADGKWVCHTRRPLSLAEIYYGLQPSVEAVTKAELEPLVEEDAKYLKYREERVPRSDHRGTW
ncbi:hypothetical protein [Actinomadura hibisca]|uniref:hypothetical protein n=1 Tax=Actinomadura hibisca TaxID=68565 RepID=UPI00082AD5C5|nr:hypothetical protein [Actinomadura hibisca]